MHPTFAEGTDMSICHLKGVQILQWEPKPCNVLACQVYQIQKECVLLGKQCCNGYKLVFVSISSSAFFLWFLSDVLLMHHFLDISCIV